MFRRRSIPLALALAAIPCLAPLPTHAEEEGATVVIGEDGEAKTEKQDLKAKFEGYIDEFPNLAEVKGELKGSPSDYAVHLKHAKEVQLGPPKVKLRPSDYVLRLIVLEPGGKKSAIIRINKTWGGIDVIGKRLDATRIFEGDKKGDYKLNDILAGRKNDFEAMEELIKKLDFFKMRSGTNEVPQELPLMLLEVVTEKEHKIVERYMNPANPDDFFQLCRKIGKAARMDLGALTRD